MRKKYCKPIYILCAALLFSTPAFADGPDLDDTEIVSSGPGMMIGSKEQEEAFSGNVSAEYTDTMKCTTILWLYRKIIRLCTWILWEKR